MATLASLTLSIIFEETHFILLKKLKQTCLDVVKEARPDLSQNPDLPVRVSSSP